jgi:hypothetical protein
MKTSEKKLVGLRRYHVNRPVKTRMKLLEALDRMESGHTVVAGPGFNWSKTTLAREAGVNINTVVRKLPGGGWAFPEINGRFEELKQKRRRVPTSCDSREEKIAELRNELERLREQNRLLALEVNRMGRQVLEEKERADRMAVYERQNASLREEVSRIQRARSAEGGSQA